MVDLGTGTTKIGFANYSEPRLVFSTVLGNKRLTDYTNAPDLKDIYVGDEAKKLRK